MSNRTQTAKKALSAAVKFLCKVNYIKFCVRSSAELTSGTIRDLYGPVHQENPVQLVFLSLHSDFHW